MMMTMMMVMMVVEVMMMVLGVHNNNIYNQWLKCNRVQGIERG